MKLNLTLAFVLGIFGAIGGLLHDLGTYRDAVNLAAKNGDPRPAFDYLSTAIDVAMGFMAAQPVAAGVSQIPGVS